MAQRISRKELKHDEFVEKAFDFGEWLEENWKTAAGYAGLAAVLIVAILGWRACTAASTPKRNCATSSASTSTGAWM